MQDLKHVNRSVTPWVIVHSHRPAYAAVVDTGSVIQAQDQRNAFEDIFVQYGVSLALLNPVATGQLVTDLRCLYFDTLILHHTSATVKGLMTMMCNGM